MVESSSSNRLCVLNLSDGTVLQLVDDDIPDPPAVSFTNDIPHLNVMWDDGTAHWLNESIIIIRGHPIAIKYWPLLYRYGTPYHFWEEFKADSGEWMKFTAIVEKLHDECKAEHAALVDHAHQEFCADFNDLFTYW
ncbi:hypothetical protein DFH29DRAFT_798584 [Suillus ampliporus]|nr:hypothetical protein DFH29DRAFT_798584 [Suillus ampliporus]